MNETMTIYPLSWIFHTTFIFFTSFAILNMLIGTVVHLMDNENQIVFDQEALEARLELNSEKSQ